MHGDDNLPALPRIPTPAPPPVAPVPFRAPWQANVRDTVVAACRLMLANLIGGLAVGVALHLLHRFSLFLPVLIAANALAVGLSLYARRYYTTLGLGLGLVVLYWLLFGYARLGQMLPF